LKSFEGNTDEVISLYLNNGENNQNISNFGSEYQNEVFSLRSISVNNKNSNSNILIENSAINLNTELEIFHMEASRFHITYHLYNEMGEPMFSFTHASKLSLVEGINKIACEFPASFFQAGQYFLSFFLIKDKREAIFLKKDILSFTVTNSQRKIGQYMGREPGFIRPQFNWKKL
jgi:lipopolysaccharide transport system ATP-binding protein